MRSIDGEVVQRKKSEMQESSMKKYLITGCAGFIGSNFVHLSLIHI